MEILKMDNIKKIYGKGEAAVNALNGVSAVINEGEMLAIMGASGSGKSTLLNILGLLDQQTEGDYYIKGKKVNDYSEKERAKLRGDFFGFVVQDFALIPSMNVLNNVQLPLDYSSASTKEKRKRVEALLTKLGIEMKIKSYPNQLSGGQKQRVAIARALINNAEVILCDEPTGALDSKNSTIIMDLFKELKKEGKTIIIVTHDKNVANCCDRTITISDGKILEQTK